MSTATTNVALNWPDATAAGADPTFMAIFDAETAGTMIGLIPFTNNTAPLAQNQFVRVPAGSGVFTVNPDAVFLAEGCKRMLEGFVGGTLYYALGTAVGSPLVFTELSGSGYARIPFVGTGYTYAS